MSDKNTVLNKTKHDRAYDDEPVFLAIKKADILIEQGKYDEAFQTLIGCPTVPGTNGHAERLWQLSRVCKCKGEPFNEDHYRWISYHFGSEGEEDIEFGKKIIDETIKKEMLVLEGKSSSEDEQRLSDLYLTQGYYVQSAILALAAECPMATARGGQPFAGDIHCSALMDAIDKKDNTYVFIESDSQSGVSGDLLLNCLSNIGTTVYYIRKPAVIEVEGLGYAEKDLVNLSFNNMEKNENIVFLTPLCLTDKETGESLYTEGRLVAHIAAQHQKDGQVILLSDKESFDRLTFQTRVAFVQVSPVAIPERNDIMLYRAGPYIPMYSRLYDFDIKEALDAPDACKISIVIATRNCPETLRYTLLSCLDQTYEDYEVVLSDNGDPGDESILALAEELNEKCIAEGRTPKIKYYHTPGPLTLPKSFEFAYLHAKGEFIFGMGSDDAVMPDALKVLARCIDENPDVDVIRWIRNSYNWPNMPNGNSNFMTYNGVTYKKDEYTSERIKSFAILMVFFSRPDLIYGLIPLCYINSGMRRRQIKKIIEKTGTFMGGVNQDVYMGILNLYLNDEILCLEYPITVAGLSGNSIGIKVHLGARNDANMKMQIEEWKKHLRIIEPESHSQAIMPLTNWDAVIFVNQLLKIQDYGINKLWGDDEIDYKAIFERALDMMSSLDKMYFVYIARLQNAAKLHGRKFHKWFKPLAEKAIREYGKRHARDLEREKTAPKRIYKINEEPDENGFVRLDASEYGIADVYKAAKFIDSRWK